ncbi:histidinol dehydrogenase [candidate division KSB1 bacterium]|nr:histidinol dehydrogenase [candidate division KSB1 bacterium]RQW05599.1 MAG: histidinol dehydrogenase [candidate division KSB1 bacterium]
MKIYQGSEINVFLQRFASRRSEVSLDVERSVRDILRNVRQNGDKALLEYGAKFDKVDYSNYPLEVPLEELRRAHAELTPELLGILRESAHNIRSFHEKDLPQSHLAWEEDGVLLGLRFTPLERVGVYVPGGLAAYPSSLLMGVVPAQVAGVRDIIVITPCNAEGRMNATLLAAAYELGIITVFRLGGAHGVAAMAFGTESVPRVDKIVGPGNIYVATAKKLLYGQCGIDMVAGPSEVLIIADQTANPVYVAADLLAQAEHDPLASAILVTNSSELAEATANEVLKQTNELPRADIINQALDSFGGIIQVNTMSDCIDLSNRLAPEHLGLHVEHAWDILGKITHAGAIFLGHYSPEAVGDYWAGPNHVLPTNGSARFFSPLRTQDFLKASSIISYTKSALEKHGEKIQTFAKTEGLAAHASAIAKRIK